MSRDVSEIVVGANGSIYVAPVGSPLPASIDDPLDDSAWVDLGYASEDGVTWTDGRSLFEVMVWQSFYAARRGVESREGSAAFQLMQWNGENVKLAWGGGDITADAEGAYRYTPPSPEDLDERALCVEWSDGSKDYRLVLPRGNVSENVETNLVRTEAAALPITFSLLGSDGADPWFFQTNDPAFADAVAGSGS